MFGKRDWMTVGLISLAQIGLILCYWAVQPGNYKLPLADAHVKEIPSAKPSANLLPPPTYRPTEDTAKGEEPNEDQLTSGGVVQTKFEPQQSDGNSIPRPGPPSNAGPGEPQPLPASVLPPDQPNLPEFVDGPKNNTPGNIIPTKVVENKLPGLEPSPLRTSGPRFPESTPPLPNIPVAKEPNLVDSPMVGQNNTSTPSQRSTTKMTVPPPFPSGVEPVPVEQKPETKQNSKTETSPEPFPLGYKTGDGKKLPVGNPEIAPNPNAKTPQTEQSPDEPIPPIPGPKVPVPPTFQEQKPGQNDFPPVPQPEERVKIEKPRDLIPDLPEPPPTRTPIPVTSPVGNPNPRTNPESTDLPPNKKKSNLALPVISEFPGKNDQDVTPKNAGVKEPVNPWKGLEPIPDSKKVGPVEGPPSVEIPPEIPAPPAFSTPPSQTVRPTPPGPGIKISEPGKSTVPTSEPPLPKPNREKTEDARKLVPTRHTPKSKGLRSDLSEQNATKKPALEHPETKSIVPVVVSRVPPELPKKVKEEDRSPWKLQLQIVRGRSILTAKTEGGAEFLIRCDNLVVKRPNGDISAKGNVQIVFNKTEGYADELHISWQKDRVELQGKVRIRTPLNGEVSEFNSDQVSLRLDRFAKATKK